MAQKRIDIVYRTLDEIQPDPKNPRRNDSAVQPVMESIREFGFRVPVVLDKNNVIRAGDTRYKAAKLLNMTKIPCICADDLNEKELRAFQLADNKTTELASWDLGLLDEMDELLGVFDMSLFGFPKKKKKKKKKDGPSVDSAPAVKDDYVVCPRCGKRFLKSEGHPKNGFSLFGEEDDAEVGFDLVGPDEDEEDGGDIA